MPDIYMDVDTAVTVPINLLPLLDDTDFKSIEINIVYNSGGIALTWHFVTCAGVITATAVTPTTSGDYDWAEDVADKGTYKIEIPASGGASINNNTEGFGWFTGVATGVLPWRGPVIGFRAAGLNDKMIESAYDTTRGLAGTALPAAVADAAGGLAISDAGGLDLDTKLANTNEITTARMGALTDLINDGRLDLLIDLILEDTGATLDGKINTIDGIVDTIVARIIGTLATGTHNPQSGDVYTLANGADGFVAIKGQTTAIEVDTQDLQTQVGVDGAGLTAIGDTRIVNLDATVSSRLAPAGTLATVTNLTNAVTVSDKTEFSLSSAGVTAVQSGLSTLTAQQVWEYAARSLSTFGTLAADIWASATRTLSVFAFGVTVTTNNDKSGYALTTAPPSANENADALLDRANAVETGWTIRKILRVIIAALGGKLSGAATTTIVVRNILDTKDRITATVDADGNRSAVTLDGD